ncbi:MAG: puncturing protein [Mu-like cryoconite phage AB09]|nr:MAG: puncturing protein [Mu-like cryoconite phage AB09]
MTAYRENDTPTLEQLIRNAMESRITELHTALPGKILSYDPAKQLASVQPSLQRKYVSGESVMIPVLNNVPVIHPRSGKSIIHIPIAPGDQVLLVFIERSMDIWKTQGGTPTPDDPRKHQYSDAVAIPGLYPFSAPITVPNPSALTILNDKARLEVKTDSVVFTGPGGEINFSPDGTFKVMSTKGVELVDLLTRLIQAIIDARTETLLGPMPLINVGADAFPALLSLLNKLKG